MKKIILASAVLFSSLSLVACDTNKTTDSDAGDNKKVIAKDSVPSEYEVTETKVETDTTKDTKTVDVDKDKNDDKH
ncbi:hypothetical protein [Pontibacter liquoris]|uniref:hypothetical protein n=1 Tax=Pontibacter liquoris TaxID=2905677 RepID=UPI001FA74F16|nr:hypothetical protein [Pontibacter liquoris]